MNINGFDFSNKKQGHPAPTSPNMFAHIVPDARKPQESQELMRNT